MTGPAGAVVSAKRARNCNSISPKRPRLPLVSRRRERDAECLSDGQHPKTANIGLGRAEGGGLRRHHAGDVLRGVPPAFAGRVRWDLLTIVALIVGVMLLAIGVLSLIFRKRMQANLDRTEFRSRVLRRPRRAPRALVLGLFDTIAGCAFIALFVVLVAH